MSTQQNKTRRQNQQNNVQKRLNARFKQKFEKKRPRKKQSHTKIHPTLNTKCDTISVSEGNINSNIALKGKKKLLQRSKTLHLESSTTNRRKHKFKSTKSISQTQNDRENNSSCRSRSSSVKVKEVTNIASLENDSAVSDSEVNIYEKPNRKYFTKGSNKYTHSHTHNTPTPTQTHNDEFYDNGASRNSRHTISFINKSMADIYENVETDTDSDIKLSRPSSVPSARRQQNKSMDFPTSPTPTSPIHHSKLIILPETESIETTAKTKRNSSVLDATKRFMSTIIKRQTEAQSHAQSQSESESQSQSESHSQSQSDIKSDKSDYEIECEVLSARKYCDYVEYEIQVRFENEEYVLYKRVKDFYDFNTSLKQQHKYKHLKLPTLPTRTRILNTMSCKFILERKVYFNNYLQSILKMKEINNSQLLFSFLQINQIKKYNVNLWKMGDSKLSFDCHHVLELRFSARNIAIEEDEYNGCLLKISRRNVHSEYYAHLTTIMITDFVIDHKHPRFSKTLLFNYYPTKDNNLKIELLLNDDINNGVAVGSANINIMHLLATHKGYLYVAINNNTYSAPPPLKHRRSMPDLIGYGQNRHSLRADENPQFLTSPCFIITAMRNDNNNNKYLVLPKPALPTNLKILAWTDDIANKLKCITNCNIDTSEFRQSIKSNKKNLSEYNYFSTKKEEKANKANAIREHIASVLLNIWKKCLDCYAKKASQNISFGHTLLSIICKLCNRFEFDLSHIQHWQNDKAFTTFQWERIMKQYYKLFLRSLEISLNIVQQQQEEKKGLSDEEDMFCKEIIGLSMIRNTKMQHKLLPLLVHEIIAIVQQSKSNRYEFLVNNCPNQDSEKRFVPHTWQENYVANIANQDNNFKILARDPFYNANNASINPRAWQWFAPPDIDKNDKIQITTNKQKQYIRQNWQFIMRFVICSIANYNRHDVMYWKKVGGFRRIERLLVEAIIWNSNNSKILDFISSLMSSSSEMRHCIGRFGKALIAATDAMYPRQVFSCFRYLREWIVNSKCPSFGLLPDSFCYIDFYAAAQYILSQEEWQIICVFLSFILHHSRLFKESFRKKMFKQLLIGQYFLKLSCHWNRLVRKYYFMVLLYCINRSGYFDEKRRKKCITNVKIEQDIISAAHRCYVLFDNMTHLILSNNKNNKNSKDNNVKAENCNFYLLDIVTNKKIIYESISDKDEKQEMNHLHSFVCDMKIVSKIENDCHLVELLNLQIAQIKTKRKEISAKYRAYIDAAFKQFANLCLRYKKIQLTKNNSWVLGQVLIPGIMYHVRDRDKHLNKFEKTDQESHKYCV